MKFAVPAAIAAAITAVTLTATVAYAESGKQSVPQIEALFSPSKETEDAMIQLIDGAKKSVHVAAMSFDSQNLAQALINAHKRGLDVRLLADLEHLQGYNEDDVKITAEEKKEYKEDQHGAVARMAKNGVSVRADVKYPTQHSKIILIDGEVVQTGSYNYTDASRDQFSENVVIIRNAPDVAKKFEEYWLQLWEGGKPFFQ